MTRSPHFLPAVLAVVLAAATARAQPATAPGPELAEGREASLPFRYFVPPPSVARPVPVVLLLHGSGERGADNIKQLKHGVARFVSSQAQTAHPCIVIAPQCPEMGWWAGDTLKLAIAAMERVGKANGGDLSRYYVTGLSMGGFGTWSALAMRPDLFAAGLPICGGGDPGTVKSFVAVPVKAFHGAGDRMVLPEKSKMMVEALKAAGGTADYVELPDAGHECWDQVYRDPDNMRWLFARNRPVGTSP